MQTLETALGSYRLERHRVPAKAKADPLRAWDAADEYLLNHLADQPSLSTHGKPVLLINDAFGALAISLHEHPVHSWSDSFSAHQAAFNNLRLNQLEAKLQAIPSTSALTTHYDLVLIKIPKTSALLEYQLSLLKPHIGEHSILIAAGMAKHIHTSTLNLFENIIGTTHTSLARKKARLIFSKNNQKNPQKTSYPKTFSDSDLHITLSNHANVFSKNHLDIGARFMLETLQKHLPEKTGLKHIIDLGCGNGVLGIMAKRLLQQQQTNSNISFVDESYMAIESARSNYITNIPFDSGAKDASFTVSDSLDQFDPDHRADLILCNPPFHQGHSMGDEVAWKMFKQSRQQLTTNGELWIVGNRHLGYHSKLKKLFGHCQTLASNKKFVVLRAKR